MRVAVRYDHLVSDIGFRADWVVDGLVIVELTSVEYMAAVHKKQTLTSIRVADKHLGLLINLGARQIKGGITRLVNNLSDGFSAFAPLRLGATLLMDSSRRLASFQTSRTRIR